MLYIEKKNLMKSSIIMMYIVPVQVIHTVGPVWKGGDKNEENELYEAVHAALKAAGKYNCKTVRLTRS